MKDAATAVVWTMTLAGFATIMVGSFMRSLPLIALGLAMFYPSGVAGMIVAGMNGSDEE